MTRQLLDIVLDMIDKAVEEYSKDVRIRVLSPHMCPKDLTYREIARMHDELLSLMRSMEKEYKAGILEWKRYNGCMRILEIVHNTLDAMERDGTSRV